MRFHIGKPPEAPDFDPQPPTWAPLREPSSIWVCQLLALPVAGVLVGPLMALWYVLTPTKSVPHHSVGALLVAFAVMIVVHEMLHALMHPGNGRSNHTIVGFWPSTLLFYAHYDYEMTRNRFAAILLFPCVSLSLSPLLLAAVFRTTTSLLPLISVLNALGSSVDVLGAAILMAQLPSQATVRNKGYKTYWKLHVQSPLANTHIDGAALI